MGLTAYLILKARAFHELMGRCTKQDLINARLQPPPEEQAKYLAKLHLWLAEGEMRKSPEQD